MGLEWAAAARGRHHRGRRMPSLSLVRAVAVIDQRVLVFVGPTRATPAQPAPVCRTPSVCLHSVCLHSLSSCPIEAPTNVYVCVQVCIGGFQKLL